jgi:hypothetical protein
MRIFSNRSKFISKAHFLQCSLLLAISCGGSGGIVDNGVKPKPGDPIPNSEDPNSEEDRVPGEADPSGIVAGNRHQILDEQFMVNLPERFAWTDREGSSPQGDRFIDHKEFVDFHWTPKVCSPSAQRTSKNNIAIYHCGVGIIHLKHPDRRPVELRHNLDAKLIDLIVDSFQIAD